MARCIVCDDIIEPFLSFGRMPVANAFITPDQRASEHFYELAVARCPACALVQLTEPLERARMFHDAYAYFSSTSRRMSSHFEEFAADVLRRVERPAPFVVELGSNDGIMLQHFVERRARVLGIEPSANVARAALDRGLATRVAFFDAELGGALRAEEGPADAIVGANVLCHVPYLDSVLTGVRRLLAPRGRFIFEDPYLPDILTGTAFDQFYDEHVCYFTATATARLAARNGLELIDLERQSVHGGSMRYVLAHRGAATPAARVAEALAYEQALGLDTDSPYQQFRARVETIRERLVGCLGELRGKGARIMGYGATAKSATVINYCGLTPDHIESICDTTPIKQGRLSPGAHIPVVPHEAFTADYPNYAVLFAWNHAAEILAKETGFEASGGRWITYVPEVEISSASATAAPRDP